MLSMHVSPIYVTRALQAGAQGYVSKGARAEELVEAVRTVAKGGRYIEHDIASELALSLMSAGDPTKDLSARELDIMRLLAQGKNLTVISEDLGISYKTVANACRRASVRSPPASSLRWGTPPWLSSRACLSLFRSERSRHGLPGSRKSEA